MRALAVALVLTAAAHAQTGTTDDAGTGAEVAQLLDAWEAGTLRDDGATALLRIALVHPAQIARLGFDADDLRDALLLHPFGTADADTTGADARLYLQARRLALAVGRPTALIGRFSYWCLSDAYRNVARSVADARLAALARGAAATYETAAPSADEFRPAGFTAGQTVAATLRRYGSCSTDVR